MYPAGPLMSSQTYETILTSSVDLDPSKLTLSVGRVTLVCAGRMTAVGPMFLVVVVVDWL